MVVLELLHLIMEVTVSEPCDVIRVMSNMHITNLSRIHGELLKLSRPQNKIINVKCKNGNKSVILIFFSAILNVFNDPPI